MKTFGSHIRRLRKAKDLTLVQLSELSGLSVPYLSNIERGVVNPSLKTLQTLGKALDLTLPEVVNFNDKLTNKLLAENQKLRRILSEIQSLVKLTS